MLPARFPNLLVNGAAGIAVGMATNIPPHNLSEVVDGLIAVIDNPGITLDELIKIIPGPDFPTAGFIHGLEGIRTAYATGRGGIQMRARALVETRRRGERQSIHRGHRDSLPGQQGEAAGADRRSRSRKED